MTRRAVRLITITVLAVAVGWVLAPLRADAWGDGRICLDGTTHTFDNEPDYYAFLDAHPDAVEGACTEEVPPSTTPSSPPTSTSTVTEPSPTMATSPPSSTPSPDTTPTSSVSGFSPTPPTPSPSRTEIYATSTVEQPGAMCMDGCTAERRTSSTSYVPTTLSPVSVGAAAATGTILPATGSTVDGVAVAAVLVLGLGVGAALLARRRPAITDTDKDDHA